MYKIVWLNPFEGAKMRQGMTKKHIETARRLEPLLNQTGRRRGQSEKMLFLREQERKQTTTQRDAKPSVKKVPGRETPCVVPLELLAAKKNSGRGILTQLNRSIGRAVTTVLIAGSALIYGLIGAVNTARGQDRANAAEVTPAPTPKTWGGLKASMLAKAADAPVVKGTPNYDVSYENGVVTFKNWNGKEDLTYWMNRDKDPLIQKMAKTPLRLLWHADVNGAGKGVYLIFDGGIIFLAPPPIGSGRIVKKMDILITNNEKLFTHDGGIIVSSKGKIIASTPSSLLIVSNYGENGSIDLNYKKVFGNDAQDLVHPMFNQSDDEHIVLRDPSIKNGAGERMKITINLTTYEIDVARDGDAATLVGSR